MVVNCLIEFDNNPYGIYFAGQVISGKVTLQSDKLKQVRGVALKINGFVHTSWSESTNNNASNNTSDTTWYTGHEDYVASLTYLMGSESSQMNDIAPGIHTYYFSCHLPQTCPSSFEGLYGHIRYTVKVILVRPWKFDQTYTTGFTVLKIMDLNYDTPLLKVPADTEIQKSYWCGPCRSDPLVLHINIPQSGYVPGQTIPVSVLVTNDSNVPVEQLKVELTMLVCYYSTSPCTRTKTERIVLTKFKGDSVMSYCKKNFTYDILVPATPPTCFNLCRLLQIAYQIEVEAKVKGMHASQVLCMPVTIGNVPLMGVIQQQPLSQSGMQRGLMNDVAMPMELNGKPVEMQVLSTNTNANTERETLPTISATVTNPPSPWAADTNIAPPSYEQAVHMRLAKINADETHDYGESEFLPRYPVFSVHSPIAPEPADIDGGFSKDVLDAANGTWL